MAGARVNNYSPSTANLTSVMATLDQTRIGFMDFEIDNRNASTSISIDPYSIIECGGSMFQFSTLEPISTTTIASTVAYMPLYVKLSPTSSQITAELSTKTPVWRNDYKGWYESTSDMYRYITRFCVDNGSIYHTSKLKDKNMFEPIFGFYSHNSTVATKNIFTSTTIGSIKDTDILNSWDESSNSFTPKFSGAYLITLAIDIIVSASTTVTTSGALSALVQNGSTAAANIVRFEQVLSTMFGLTTSTASTPSTTVIREKVVYNSGIGIFKKYLSTNDRLEVYSYAYNAQNIKSMLKIELL